MTTVPGLLLAVMAATSPAPRGEVLDFSSRNCGPCQRMAPLVARLERDGLPIRAVDVDQQRDLAQRFNITAMPTFVLLVDGKEIDRHVGMMEESTLRAWIRRIPSDSPTAPLLASAGAGGTSPFVADPAVQLGQPQAFPQAQRSAAVPAAGASEPPRRDAPASQNPAPQGGLATNPGRPAEIEIRGSDSPLFEPATVPQPSDPMSASVRLRVTIDGKINLGSGTIIACHDGQALIATCGHIFRGSNESSRIEVNLFRNGSEPAFAGRLVKFDLESDVGLVMIETSQPLHCVPVARDLQRAREQEQVLNIGCSGGQPPTAEELVVTAVNPYLGPDNLECTGVPVQGRSGGGLFRSTGELVGICIAADPQRKRGVYAGLLALHELLAAAGYSSLFRTPETAVAAATAPEPQRPAETPPAAAAHSGSLLDSLSTEREFPGTVAAGASDLLSDFSSRGAAPPVAGTPVQIGPSATDAEIVCIIRPRNQPESASQVVIIHQASPKLLSYLRGEMGTSTGGGSGAVATAGELRRSRDGSVPTMGVSPARPLTPGDDLRPGTESISQKPTLQATALTATPFPRRYVRSQLAH